MRRDRHTLVRCWSARIRACTWRRSFLLEDKVVLLLTRDVAIFWFDCVCYCCPSSSLAVASTTFRSFSFLAILSSTMILTGVDKNVGNDRIESICWRVTINLNMRSCLKWFKWFLQPESVNREKINASLSLSRFQCQGKCTVDQNKSIFWRLLRLVSWLS